MAPVLLEASVVVNNSLLVSATLSALVVSLITVVASVLVDIASSDETSERVDDSEPSTLSRSVVADCDTEAVRSQRVLLL